MDITTLIDTLHIEKKKGLQVHACALLLLCCQVHAENLITGTGTTVEEVGKVIQVVGRVLVDDKDLRSGERVLEGQKLKTGEDGYIYLQTVDKGFVIVRPSSSLRILSYRIDKSQPANSRFKFELERGVARSISGQAVPAARQNYRFNTPVAAIGVLGTDFTVFTDQTTTRVIVKSGGVVVSGFGEGCAIEGFGPCDTPSRQQLLANQVGQMLQVSRGNMAPQLLRGGSSSPEVVVPPRSDEPIKTENIFSTESNLAPVKMATLEEAHRAAIAAGPPAIVWGRWQPIADDPANIKLLEMINRGKWTALTSYFAVQSDGLVPSLMESGQSVGFQLKSYKAQIESDKSISTAQIANSSLFINFSQRSFQTKFDLLVGGERFAQWAEGKLGQGGELANVSQFTQGSNMFVQGVVAQPASSVGLQAGYVFQSRLDGVRTASGVTYWMAK